MARTTQFLLIRHIRFNHTGQVFADHVAVSDTLIGAQNYGTKLIKKMYEIDMYFEPKGWGNSRTDDFDSNSAHNAMVWFSVQPIKRVTQRATV